MNDPGDRGEYDLDVVLDALRDARDMIRCLDDENSLLPRLDAILAADDAALLATSGLIKKAFAT